MIEFLTGYSSGVWWFDRLADVCVGVIACFVLALLAWLWVTRDRGHYITSREQRVVTAIREKITRAATADLTQEPKQRPFGHRKTSTSKT